VEEASVVLQNTMWALALKLVWLILLMFIFYAAPFFLVRALRFPVKLANTLASLCSLVGFYIWVQYVIS
jgi:hypothetical protein